MSTEEAKPKSFTFGDGATVAIGEWSQTLITEQMARFRRTSNPRPEVPTKKSTIKQKGENGIEDVEILEDDPRDPTYQAALKEYRANSNKFRMVAALCAGIELTDEQREEVIEARDMGFDPADFYGVECFDFDEAFYIWLHIDQSSEEINQLVEVTGAAAIEDLGRVAEIMDSFRDRRLGGVRIPADRGGPEKGKRQKANKNKDGG